MNFNCISDILFYPLRCFTAYSSILRTWRTSFLLSSATLLSILRSRQVYFCRNACIRTFHPRVRQRYRIASTVVHMRLAKAKGADIVCMVWMLNSHRFKLYLRPDLLPEFVIRISGHEWRVHSRVVSEQSAFFEKVCKGPFRVCHLMSGPTT